MKSINQTTAASLIYKHVNIRQKLEQHKYIDIIYYLFSANFYKLKQDGDIDPVTKNYLLFTYTNPCYFLFNWFNNDHEGILNAKLYIEGKQMTRIKVETYFNSTIDEILSIPESNFLRLRQDSIIGYQLPDMTRNMKLDIVNGLISMQEKDRIFSKVEIKEFLVYYVFNLLISLVNEKNVSFPYTLIDDILGQIEIACEEILSKAHYKYEQVDPKSEITFNIHNLLVPQLTKMYLNYVNENNP